VELTKEQVDRQDEVDNACYALLLELGRCYAAGLPWDIEEISTVREAVQSVLVEKRHIMSDMEFYPYLEEHKGKKALCRLGYCATKKSHYAGGNQKLFDQIKNGECPICGGEVQQ
jgi:hypothetical protein